MKGVAKLKGNSFYGKMIEDLGRRKSTKFTRKEKLVDKALRSPFFEIAGAYEIKEFKQTVMIKRPYQCGTAVYQLAKLRMFEFYYGFVDKYFSRQDFELCYMDTDSFYLAMSGDSLDEMKQAYEADKKNWVATDKFSEKTPGLLEPEFVGTKNVWLTAKNIGFRVCDQGMVTFEQNKLGFSAYYDKRYVLADGIHTRPLVGRRGDCLKSFSWNTRLSILFIKLLCLMKE